MFLYDQFAGLDEALEYVGHAFSVVMRLDPTSYACFVLHIEHRVYSCIGPACARLKHDVEFTNLGSRAI